MNIDAIIVDDKIQLTLVNFISNKITYDDIARNGVGTYLTQKDDNDIQAFDGFNLYGDYGIYTLDKIPTIKDFSNLGKLTKKQKKSLRLIQKSIIEASAIDESITDELSEEEEKRCQYMMNWFITGIGGPMIDAILLEAPILGYSP